MSTIEPISIIVPVFNSAVSLGAGLGALQPLRQRGHEILVVDGGSRDGSVTQARKLADRVLLSGTGTALQMNTGSEYASHELLLFLPLDCRLPDNADDLIAQALLPPNRQWGHFRLRFAGGGLAAWAMTALINRRSLKEGAVMAEQAIFVRRQFLAQVRGLDTTDPRSLCRRLLVAAQPVCLPQAVTSITSDLRSLL